MAVMNAGQADGPAGSGLQNPTAPTTQSRAYQSAEVWFARFHCNSDADKSIVFRILLQVYGSTEWDCANGAGSARARPCDGRRVNLF